MGASGLPAVVVPLWHIASGAKISRRGGHVRKRGRSSSSRCMFLSGSNAFCLFRYDVAAAANTAGFAMAFTCIATPPPPRSFSAACRRPSSPSSWCSRWQMLLQLTIPTATYAFMTTIHDTAVHQPHNYCWYLVLIIRTNPYFYFVRCIPSPLLLLLSICCLELGRVIPWWQATYAPGSEAPSMIEIHCSMREVELLQLFVG